MSSSSLPAPPRRSRRRALLCGAALGWSLGALAACRGAPPAPSREPAPAAPSAATLGPGTHELRFRDRPLSVAIPQGVTAAPLVVYLHHLGGDGSDGERYLALGAVARARGLVYAVPRSLALEGQPAWNATDGCCQREQVTDDATYLAELVTDLVARAPVDPRRVFLIGHSNGGFMAHRMACDHPALIAGIASIAGATWSDLARCTPRTPVSVLQVHGTADRTIRYGGGFFQGGPYPPARQALTAWTAFDRCSVPPTDGTTFLLARPPREAAPPAAVTPAEAGGCAQGTAVALWTVADGDHVPIEGQAAGAAVLDWLLAHPRR